MFTSLDFYARIESARYQEEQRKAELWRLLQPGKRTQQGWLARSQCWLFCWLGHRLIQLGQQLEQLGYRGANLAELGIEESR